ncbi:MAG: glycosyltransferase [Pseudomonadota bacterium]|nr:glycosyltransferase [Pseudomonadota bacterium]
MTVLHALGSAADGGAETYFTDLVAALARGGESQVAAIRAHDGRLKALKRARVPTTVLPFGGLLDWRTRRRLRAYAVDWKASVLLAWMNRAARHSPEGAWARIGRLGGYYDLKNYRGFEALVANTADIRDWMVREGWPAERAHHIPNFAAARTPPPLLRAEFETPERVPLLLGMGRLHPSKAHDVSLRALQRLPDAWLWIAGSGPLEAELKRLAEELGVAERVRWLGWRDDASALYRTADLCVFPSRFEPLGNVVIQAWAHGVPVVAARSVGPAALIHDGEDGRLVPVDDVEALASAVQELIDDRALRYCLAERGRAVAAAEFSEEAVVPQWRTLFARYGAR